MMWIAKGLFLLLFTLSVFLGYGLLEAIQNAALLMAFISGIFHASHTIRLEP